jgi:xanthine dehydrogenase accessory factor
MALTADGRIAGSVSGGCVEAAVVEAGLEVLRAGRPRLLRFGVSDESAWSVGLSCGGTIEVFVQPLDAEFHAAVRAAVVEESPAALVTLLSGDAASLGARLLVRPGRERLGSLGADLDAAGASAAEAALAGGGSERLRLAAASGAEHDAFVEVLQPPPTLVVVGGVHIAIALTQLARALGYRTIVVDPRAAFGDERRFPHADRVLQDWPDEALRQVGLGAQTAVAVLTHDPKLDDPALRAALPSEAFYVGALGSRATQAKRRQRLLEAGVGEAPLARLHAPIGLDLGGRTPEEIALAVMAQIVAARHGRQPVASGTATA